jgi:MFS family permease
MEVRIMTTARTPWYFNPMVLLLAGCIVAIINFGVRSTFGLFTDHITNFHGWPRETYSLAIALQNLFWGAMTPVAGALADRYGSARVLITGAVIYAIGIVTMAQADTAALMHLGGGVLAGTGIAFSSFGIVMAALGRLVPPEKRSWAFGLATASGSLGQFIFCVWLAGRVAWSGWQHIVDHAVCPALPRSKHHDQQTRCRRNIVEPARCH